tara:strand:- start:390 stop:821 length:432 start_codon:yes stop_codon:yes gene_type:complete
MLLYLYILCFPAQDELDTMYTIGKSPIHGYGCFASKKIMPYTDMGVITVHTTEGIKRMDDPSREGRFYKSSTGLNWREYRLLGRYINHSSTPNCEVYRSSPLTFGVRTSTIIKYRDEITIDYKRLRDFYMDGFMDDLNKNKSI